MYLDIEDIDTITVDFTAHCNAMCGNCSRNLGGVEVNPRMPLEHMSPATFKNLFSENVLRNINQIVFNGSYGDPLVSPHLFECLDYLKDYEKPIIHIHTNGGMRQPKYFDELARKLKDFPFPTHVVFSIDGLEDTNHLYRRNVKWNKVMENAQAFLDAGGLGRWRMLVFEHNAHQLEQAEELSNKMGFAKFDINGGHTFTAMNSMVNKAIEKFKANKREQARTIKYDTSKLDNLKRLKDLKQKHGSLADGFKKSCITCKWQKKRKIQVSHVGEVFPCCYMLSDRYPREVQSPYAQEVSKVDWLNVNDMPLEVILDSPFFAQDLPESWASENRFKICEVTCGEV